MKLSNEPNCRPMRMQRTNTSAASTTPWWVGIVARLEQLETEMEGLRNRLAAAELKANRNPDDW